MSRLRVDWCSSEAARYAVLRWHYSETMPPIKTVRVGVWWDDVFKGAVIFSRPCRNQHKMFKLSPTEVCELARVALDRHEGFHVTAVVARAIKLLKQRCPALRLVVSFADPAEGHLGRIYQAGNWLYTGRSAPVRTLVHQGKKIHRRKFTGASFDNPRSKPPVGSVWVAVPGKHRYLMPLDRAMRRQVEPLAQPYPQPADALTEGAGLQPGQAVRPRPSASDEPAAVVPTAEAAP